MKRTMNKETIKATEEETLTTDGAPQLWQPCDSCGREPSYPCDDGRFRCKECGGGYINKDTPRPVATTPATPAPISTETPNDVAAVRRGEQCCSCGGRDVSPDWLKIAAADPDWAEDNCMCDWCASHVEGDE